MAFGNHPTYTVRRTHKGARAWTVAVSSALVHGPTTKAKAVAWAQRFIKKNGGGTLNIADGGR